MTSCWWMRNRTRKDCMLVHIPLREGLGCCVIEWQWMLKTMIPLMKGRKFSIWLIQLTELLVLPYKPKNRRFRRFCVSELLGLFEFCTKEGLWCIISSFTYLFLNYMHMFTTHQFTVHHSGPSWSYKKLHVKVAFTSSINLPSLLRKLSWAKRKITQIFNLMKNVEIPRVKWITKSL